MKRLNILISSIAAGILISIGAIGYLSYCKTSVFAGSFLFALGLFSIIEYKLYLYTGKVGYIFENKKGYLLDLLICYIGNLIGTVAMGYLLSLTRLDIQNAAINIANIKLNDSLISLFLLAFLCGMMIFIAVDINKKETHQVNKIMATFICVMLFIVSGFEHSIADMFYFSLANKWCFDAILRILIISIGNLAGSVSLYYLFKYSNKRVKE